MSSNPSQRYYGDDRDYLEDIYPTCATFVLIKKPEAAIRYIEISLDLTNDEDRRLFGLLCYSYEDSYDWQLFPLVYQSSNQGRVTWYNDSQVIRTASLAEGLARFDEFTAEISSA